MLISILLLKLAAWAIIFQNPSGPYKQLLNSLQQIVEAY